MSNTTDDFVSWLNGASFPETVLLVLNQPIEQPQLFATAWDACGYHVVTDGAANQLKKVSEKTGIDYMPDFVVGDFDSVDPDVREFYVAKGVPFIKDGDQYATDFMKAMAQSHKRFDNPQKPRKFLAFGALGGRVDHTWHSYMCLSLAARAGDQLVLVSDQSLTILVPAGTHRFETPRNLVGTTCGYAPLEGSAIVSTHGFTWDVTDFNISFTTRLSTSNILNSETVEIKTDKPVMFTVEIRKELQH